MPVMPYGYKTENGKAVIDEETALQIRKVFEGYLSGMSLVEAAGKAGFHMNHPSVKRIICNRRYMGDAFYPRLIEPSMFYAANTEMSRRAKALGRTNRKSTYFPPVIYREFETDAVELISENPAVQAEYAYSRIRKKEDADADE